MKNILINFASHEMNQSVLVTDINKLDEEIPEQKTIIDAILWSLDPTTGKHKKFDWLECDKDYGPYDTNGYKMHNILQEIYGFPKVPYTVEYQLSVRCDV